MVWHVYGRCVMQVLPLSSSWFLDRLSVQFSSSFFRSQFCHLISFGDDHDNKGCGIRDRHNLAWRTGFYDSSDVCGDRKARRGKKNCDLYRGLVSIVKRSLHLYFICHRLCHSTVCHHCSLLPGRITPLQEEITWTPESDCA